MCAKRANAQFPRRRRYAATDIAELRPMNLIQPLLNSFPPQSWGALAGTLNETPERTRQGLADALPMFFASMIGKASTAAGAAGLLSMMRNTNIDLDRVASGRDAPVAEPSLLREGGNLAHSVM